MKKNIIILLISLVCLAMVAGASTASAEQAKDFTGSKTIGPAGSTTTITTSSNVYCSLYSSSQQYAAICHNKAGDKAYATGGGGSNATGIYYQSNSSWIGSAAADPGDLLSSSTFTAGSPWIAQ